MSLFPPHLNPTNHKPRNLNSISQTDNTPSTSPSQAKAPSPHNAPPPSASAKPSPTSPPRQGAHGGSWPPPSPPQLPSPPAQQSFTVCTSTASMCWKPPSPAPCRRASQRLPSPHQRRPLVQQVRQPRRLRRLGQGQGRVARCLQVLLLVLRSGLCCWCLLLRRRGGFSISVGHRASRRIRLLWHRMNSQRVCLGYMSLAMSGGRCRLKWMGGVKRNRGFMSWGVNLV